MTASVDTKNMSSFDIACIVATEPGSHAEVARRIGRSKTHVSTLRRIMRDGASLLLNAWGIGDIPFDLVRDIATRERLEQLAIVRKYLKATRGRNRKAKGEARAVVFKALGKGKDV